MVDIGVLDTIKEYAQFASGLGGGISTANVEAMAWLAFSEYGWIIMTGAFGFLGLMGFMLYRFHVETREEV